MKINTLLFLSLAGITLTAGVVRPLACLVSAPEVAVIDSVLPAAGPLRHLSAATGGRVWEVYVQAGSPVKRGQLVAKVAVPLHTVAQQQAETEVQQAHLHHAQLLNAAPGQVSAEALEQARQRVAASSRQLAAIPRQLSFIYIQAPTDGIVAASPTRTGTYVAGADTVVSIRVAATPAFGIATN